MTKPSSAEVKKGAVYYAYGGNITYDSETKEYVLRGKNHNDIQIERRYAKFKIAKQIIKKL